MLAESIKSYVDAAFTGLWVCSSEPEEAVREISRVGKAEEWEMFVWDCAQGLRALGQSGSGGSKNPQEAAVALTKQSSTQKPTVIFLHNFHRFLHLPDVVQLMANNLQAAKITQTIAIVLSPVETIPIELKTYFTVLHHDLPDSEQLKGIHNGILAQPLDTHVDEKILSAAAGMTRYEAENAFAYSIVTKQCVDPRTIWELKAQVLSKSNGLSLYRGTERFDTLGGLSNVKDFCLKALTSKSKSKAKGIIAYGLPGCGKSAFAYTLGNEVGRPTICVDIGSMLGKYVGDSEASFRRCFQTLEACSPCIGFFDEMDRGMAGGNGDLDSGVMARFIGMLLTWRQDTKADVFLLATTNSVSNMPAPLLRGGRTNAIFFFDLPTRQEKDSIWSMYRKSYEIPEEQKLPEDTDWTGAEIRNACELASLLNVPLEKAKEFVVPIAVTSQGAVGELREWAEGRVISASYPGIYHRSKTVGNKPEKRRSIKPSQGESMN